jgi:hypothetical protein
MKAIVKYAWSAWLGMSVGICGFYVTDYEFWIICAPMWILIALHDWCIIKEADNEPL